ncbi:helix-turn-helix domain-containing protein [Vibrio sp. 947]|uniref:ParB/RepB/Spo0J family partition protein n=1 Tax=unclassified Vibrio TaxID=2614977 RepID=UPI002963F16C|nr:MULTISPECIES: helix-turn-helix domain-containing protein [unclassified Vibrio]MDW1583952.1 helix-turn-helix domain-containing protein [Vibrio sp. Vb2897]MDW1642192.1 helix-turn-helix domain-containing protein [Vibrio sp. Vb2896]MDW1927464.1 helix-turn-helix domain-containing protein [Vibrio sp. 947]
MAKSKKAIGTASATATGVALATNQTLRKISNEGNVDVKRINGFKADPRLLWIEEGYNVREICPDHVEGFVRSYTDGKYVPPIEVVVVEVDGVQRLKVIEGHHRTIALQKLMSMGANVEEIQVIEVQGDEIAQLSRMIKSSEGRELTPMETAGAYHRMKQLGMTQTEVAEELGTTPAQVSNYLQLLKAPVELQAMIQSGEYSATSAWCNIRKCGSEAALAIAKEEVRAKAEKQAAKTQGKKVPKTKTTSKLKKLRLAPKKVDKMSNIVTSLADQVTPEAIENNQGVELTMDVSVAQLILSLAGEVSEINSHNAEAEQNLKQIAALKDYEAPENSGAYEEAEEIAA